MKLAVFGALDDPEVGHVSTLAVRRGHQIIHIAPEGWAGDGREPHSIWMTRERGVRAELGLVDVLDADAAWVRAHPNPFPTVEARPGLPPVERAAVAELMWHARQRAAAVSGLIELLVARKKMVINARNISPAVAMPVLAAAGLRVVDSLVTDDVEAAREFSTGRRVRVRAVDGEGRSFDFDPQRELKKSPVLVQEIPATGQAVRVLIVGELVASSVTLPATPIELPAAVLSVADEARKALGLIFAAVDLVLDPARPELYQITGVDAQPSYLEIEKGTGHEISDALLDALED